MTLPSEVREALNIEEGDILEFELVNVVRKPETRSILRDATKENVNA